MPKQVKKQKQKQGKQKQEQTVIVNVSTGKSRRTAAPVSKPQQLSPLALQNATNIQLLTGLTNLFAAQKKPEFTRTLSTEPIVSPPVTDTFKNTIETQTEMPTITLSTEEFAPIKMPTSRSGIFLKSGALNLKSKEFKKLPAEEKRQLIDEDKYREKMIENLKALEKEEKQREKEQKAQQKALEKEEKQREKEEKAQQKALEKEQKAQQAAPPEPTKKLDLIENMKRYQQYKKTSLEEQKAPQPFEHLGLSVEEEPKLLQQKQKAQEQPKKRLIIDSSSEEDTKPPIAPKTNLIENMKRYQQYKKTSLEEQKAPRPFEGLDFSSSGEKQINPPL